MGGEVEKFSLVTNLLKPLLATPFSVVLTLLISSMLFSCQDKPQYSMEHSDNVNHGEYEGSIFVPEYDENTRPDSTVANTLPSMSEVLSWDLDKQQEAFLGILLTAMTDPEVADYVFTTANQKFDGDYNFLLASAKSTPTRIRYRSINLISLINEKLTSRIGSNFDTTTFKKIVDNIILNRPLKQIAVPLYAEMKNKLYKYTPNKKILGVVIPEDFDEKKDKTLEVIEQWGEKKIFEIDAMPSMDVTFIIFGTNERTYAESKIGKVTQGVSSFGKGEKVLENGEWAISRIPNIMLSSTAQSKQVDYTISNDTLQQHKHISSILCENHSYKDILESQLEFERSKPLYEEWYDSKEGIDDLTDRCPYCQEKAGLILNNQMRSHWCGGTGISWKACTENIVPCKFECGYNERKSCNDDSGTAWEEKLRNHYASCDLRPIKCAYSGCPVEFSYKDIKNEPLPNSLDRHLMECQYYKTECPGNGCTYSDYAFNVKQHYHNNGNPCDKIVDYKADWTPINPDPFAKEQNPGTIPYYTCITEVHFGSEDALRKVEAWALGDPEVYYTVTHSNIKKPDTKLADVFYRDPTVDILGWTGVDVTAPKYLNNTIFDTWTSHLMGGEGETVLIAFQEMDGGKKDYGKHKAKAIFTAVKTVENTFIVAEHVGVELAVVSLAASLVTVATDCLIDIIIGDDYIGEAYIKHNDELQKTYQVRHGDTDNFFVTISKNRVLSKH